MSAGRVTRTLFRSMLREIRGVAPAGAGANAPRIFLQSRPDKSKWGHGAYLPASTQVDALLELLPLRVGTLAVNWTMTKRGGPVPDPDTCREGFTRGELSALTREVFKQKAKEETADGRAEAQDDAFEGLRILAAQQQQQLSSSSCLTRGMRVRVATLLFQHQPSHMDAGGNFRPSKFLFVYRITLENEGKETMQLQARAWEFLDASGNIVGSIAKGSGATGVVGKQPVLKPGQVFEYHSGVELHTSEGRMSGSFQMRTVPEDGIIAADGQDGGEEFDVFVAPTALRTPPGYDPSEAARAASEGKRGER